jgi:hypothetical protein
MANAYINISQALSPGDLLYINAKKQLQADIIITPNTIIFTGASILQPSSLLPETTINDFEFYINGQNAPSLIASFNSYIGGVSITFDTDQLGFELETSDEVIAIGKFA